MTSQEKLNLVTNYFSEDWAIKKAMQLLEDYDKAQQPTQAQATAVPMSHKDAKALVLKYGNDPLHLVLQVERHHGIKGGHYGAE